MNKLLIALALAPAAALVAPSVPRASVLQRLIDQTGDAAHMMNPLAHTRAYRRASASCCGRGTRCHRCGQQASKLAARPPT